MEPISRGGSVSLLIRSFAHVVVQRSRGYVKQSQKQHGGREAIFPEREDPQVVDYSIKKTYGNLLTLVEKAFNKEKPLFSLAIYYPLLITKDPMPPLNRWRKDDKRSRELDRIGFLKRFESSARAFELSCETLLEKLLAGYQA